MATKKHIIPFEATHPGILIKDELEAREGVNQKDLAKQLGVKASFLNEIIKGKRPITADFAILLEEVLEIPADYWMKFQSQYEIDVARVKERNIQRVRNIEIWKIIKEYVPISYFKKYKYLTDTIENDIAKIKSIYNVCTIDDLIDLSTKSKLAYFRKSEKLTINEKNMFAWTSLASYEARKQKVNTFYLENIKQLCIQLNKIFYKNENTIEETRNLLFQYGIKFVTIPKLDKTPIDGYSFWSDNNPVIALTLRHNRIDNFAFTIMHEIGHITLHLYNNKDKIYIDLSKSDKECIVEKEADAFAKNSLIPLNIWREIKRKNSFFSGRVFYSVGEKYKINPAILYGRYCYENDNYSYKTNIDKRLK